MIRCKLLSSQKLIESFLNMSPGSKKRCSELKDKLIHSGKASVPSTNIIGSEYLLWLEKKGIVKVIK